MCVCVCVVHARVCVCVRVHMWVGGRVFTCVCEWKKHLVEAPCWRSTTQKLYMHDHRKSERSGGAGTGRVWESSMCEADAIMAPFSKKAAAAEEEKSERVCDPRGTRPRTEGARQDPRALLQCGAPRE